MLRNTAGQKWRVIAFNSTSGAPVTGDAANITANISIDYGARVATTDVNPTEAEDGYYYFDLARAETDGYMLELFPESSTPNVVVLGGYRTTTTPPAVPSGGQNISPTEVLFGYGPSGSSMDFNCYNAVKEVWNGTAFVVWNAADFASYRVAATEIGSTGQYFATPPAGTVTYELRDRGASLALSYVRWFYVPTSIACGFGTSGDDYDFNAFKNNQVWDGTEFVDWDDADYLDYRIAATELTGSGRFYPSTDIPTNADRYEMRVRGASLLLSLVQFEGDYSAPAVAGFCRVDIVALRNSSPEKVRVLIHSEDNSGRIGSSAFINRAFDGETDLNGLLSVNLPWSSTAGVGRYRFKLFSLATGALLHDRTCTVPDLDSAQYDDLT